ncbi:MAG: ankyrin repeat domain-containing protein [Planctomycetota bacterium]
MASPSRDDFFAAVRANDVQRVRAMLNDDPSLAQARQPGDATLLNKQVWRDKQVVPIDTGDTRDSPALHHAVFHANVEMAALLLEEGADVHALGYENNHEMTPAIVLAAWEGGMDVVRLLLDHGADPNAISGNGVTPLSTAKRHGSKDRVALLEAHGADR